MLAQVETRDRGTPHDLDDIDAVVMEEQRVVATLLDGARSPRVAPAPVPSPPPAGRSAVAEQAVRWWVILRGVRRLEHVATLRERLAKVSVCVGANVVGLSSSEVRLSVIMPPRVTQEQLEAGIRDMFAPLDSNVRVEVAR